MQTKEAYKLNNKFDSWFDLVINSGNDLIHSFNNLASCDFNSLDVTFSNHFEKLESLYDSISDSCLFNRDISDHSLEGEIAVLKCIAEKILLSEFLAKNHFQDDSRNDMKLKLDSLKSHFSDLAFYTTAQPLIIQDVNDFIELNTKLSDNSIIVANHLKRYFAKLKLTASIINDETNLLDDYKSKFDEINSKINEFKIYINSLNLTQYDDEFATHSPGIVDIRDEFLYKLNNLLDLKNSFNSNIVPIETILDRAREFKDRYNKAKDLSEFRLNEVINLNLKMDRKRLDLCTSFEEMCDLLRKEDDALNHVKDLAAELQPKLLDAVKEQLKVMELLQ